jgi:hypothetical protein
MLVSAGYKVELLSFVGVERRRRKAVRMQRKKDVD